MRQLPDGGLYPDDYFPECVSFRLCQDVACGHDHQLRSGRCPGGTSLQTERKGPEVCLGEVNATVVHQSDFRADMSSKERRVPRSAGRSITSPCHPGDDARSHVR